MIEFQLQISDKVNKTSQSEQHASVYGIYLFFENIVF
jgi:hypothetical protein